MERRELLRLLASVGAGGVVSTRGATRSIGQARVRYELHGRGPALLIGPPIRASNSSPGGDPMAVIRQGYLDRLVDRYRVVVMDYPPSGAEAAAVVSSFDPDHVCADSSPWSTQLAPTGLRGTGIRGVGSLGFSGRPERIA